MACQCVAAAGGPDWLGRQRARAPAALLREELLLKWGPPTMPPRRIMEGNLKREPGGRTGSAARRAASEYSIPRPLFSACATLRLRGR